MKKNRVSWLHFDMDPRIEIDPLRSKESKVQFIPVRIPMFEKLTPMAPRNDGEASVLTDTRLNGRPRRNDPIRRSQGEITQILV
jgi:hypothetical protein